MDLLAIAQNTVKIILLVGMPSLMISMIIGLIISIFYAVTQVNDAALSFVPKMIFVSAFILFTVRRIPGIIIQLVQHLLQLNCICHLYVAVFFDDKFREAIF